METNLNSLNRKLTFRNAQIEKSWHKKQFFAQNLYKKCYLIYTRDQKILLPDMKK